MTDAPEKGRDTTGQGRAIGPDPEEHHWTRLFLLVLSPAGSKDLTDHSARLVYALFQALERALCLFLAWSTNHREGGSATGGSARSSAVGPAGDPTDRSREDRLDRTDLPGGRGRGLSVGWRGVASQLDATEGMDHE